ncbi:MAG TPA: hypothetical protein VEJ63_14720 [Planctomycetota bacterium]|nr:hypothetical protein [Planctomycetota bacterium]
MATGEKKSWGAGFNRRLAKAETVLILALLSEALLNPWLYSLPQIPGWGKTLIKMLVVVGCFGPVFKFISGMIDHTVDSTHMVGKRWFSMPRVATHLALILGLFVGFYWTMHHTTPWQDFAAYRKQQNQQQRFARIPMSHSVEADE